LKEIHMEGLLGTWGRLVTGYRPALAIEITRECPLRCPGCYAYGDTHLGGEVTLRQLHDHRGQALVDGILQLVDVHRPLHVSIVGGEPLVRVRELETLLPTLSRRGLHVQLVTSAVREIPGAWRHLPRLSIVVSIDGLQPEHDARRAPATYDRILRHIAGHRITIHCTITRQQVRRPGYLDEFLTFWSAREETSKIWMSLYTPQVGEDSPEMLTPDDRAHVVAELRTLRLKHPRLALPNGLLDVYATPPGSPDECVFARATTNVSADLQTRITPCLFGGEPDCSNCGCIASAGLAAVSRHRLFGVLRVGAIFDSSLAVGARAARWRARHLSTRRPSGAGRTTA
jgi:MoaA/NifB/PqqE/SkfB family radical SAM enzyme